MHTSPAPANTSVKGWLQQWVAPPTMIALLTFGGMTFVAHYRLGQVEVAIAEIRLEMQRDRESTARDYPRKDVLIEQLKAIQNQLEDLKTSLNIYKRKGSETP